MNNNYLKKISSNFSEEGNLSSKNIDESGDIELKDLTEIDVFSSKYGFDDLFTERMLKPECKWNEKKKAFDDLTKFTEPTKITNIKNTDRTNFNEMVKKLLKQPNINVVHSIINALNNLALGLNNNYTEATPSEYSCEAGYTLDGTKCNKTEEEPAEHERVCPEGFTRIDNDRCINKEKTVEKVTGYTCEEGAKLENNKCVYYEQVEPKAK